MWLKLWCGKPVIAEVGGFYRFPPFKLLKEQRCHSGYSAAGARHSGSPL
jgi:hypothetical protein